jgi:hypothetical protein
VLAPLSALSASLLVSSFVFVDTSGATGDRPTVEALEGQIAGALLDAGHALTASPLRADRVLQLSGPTAEGTWLVLGDGAAPWSVELPGDPAAIDAPLLQRDLLAGVGPPRKRTGDRIAVAVAIAAFEPALEETLQRELPLAMLRAGLPITRQRQPIDVRVCVAVQPDAVRLSSAQPGTACGAVLGRLAQPTRFDAPTLVTVLSDAATKLGTDALGHAQVNRPVPDAPKDDDGTLEELFTTKASDRVPAKVGTLQPDRLRWGWGLLVPKTILFTGGAGLLTRPPHLDPAGQLEARALFPLGITAGVFGRATYSGTLNSPVIESTWLVGVGYEHTAGYGLTLRAGLYAGGRVHFWQGPAGGVLLDPVVGVIVGARYTILPTLDLDVTLPLTGTTARSHLLDDGSGWSRRELGVGLSVGLAWAWDPPW